MDKRLRILSISQSIFPDSHGGVERVAYETLSRLAARGHSVDVVGQRSRPGSPATEEIDGVTVHRYGREPGSQGFGGRSIDALFASRPVIGRLLEEKTFDVVVPHHFFPYYAYLKVRRAPRAAEVMTFHASFWQELRLEGAERRIAKPLESLLFGRFVRRVESACLRRASRIVVLSDFSREQLLSYYPFADRKVRKIPGGVDVERFRPADDRDGVREELGLPTGRPIIFTARRLVPRMGLENLIAALAHVRESFPSALAVIAGRGRLADSLKERVARLGLQGVVTFAGFVNDDDLVKYYQAADLFVLPSLAFEGFGLVTLEALACGTPALGTPIGATPEILRPLAMQLVLGGTETSAIGGGVRVMLEWLSDEAAADRLRAQCREYVVTKYRWDLAVDSLEGLFTEVASAGGEHE